MDALLSLTTLTLLEIVLGIDNIIFISILAGKLPEHQRKTARQLGLLGALITRLGLLATIAWIAQLTTPLFEVAGVPLSGKSLILIAGGAFLIFKATREIHDKLEGAEHTPQAKLKRPTLPMTIAQIMVIDIVFSLDSVITAVGMSNNLAIMVLANIIALGVMLAASGAISDFVDRHPTIKVLALSFLMMIGLFLVLDGVGMHVPKGYIYFAMGFSLFVEFINIRVSGKAKPVQLHNVPKGP
ncbi:TerC family protein [bacterium]|nr:TerC family protein [bacterium]